MLHLYLLLARVRCQERSAAKMWEQLLVDHFFLEAEERMDLLHGLRSAALRQRFLRDLFHQWRGLVLSLDEGVARGDAVLAAAVWRNLYKARDDVDPRVLAAVVSYLRRNLRRLDRTADVESLAYLGRSPFEPPAADELALVDRPARAMADKV